MKTRQTATKQQLIDMCVKISSTHDDDDAMQAVELIMNPVNNRVKMGDAYETALGYNPITAFDKEDIGALIDDIAADTSCPTALSDVLRSKKIELIGKAMSIFELRRDSHLRDALAEAATLAMSPELALELQTILVGDPDAVEDSEDDSDDETVDGEEEDDDGTESDDDDGIEFTSF